MGYADWDVRGGFVEAAGFAGLVESGGVCTLTLTRAGATVQATNAAQPDASTTNCGAFQVPGSQLVPGAWRATLSYQSGTAHGTSSSTTVTVPR
jgi:hypothetical protein